jgi:transposase-like protein
MPARCQRGSKVPSSRRAAELVLSGELTVAAACERFGIGRGSVWSAVDRLRKERAAGGATP